MLALSASRMVRRWVVWPLPVSKRAVGEGEGDGFVAFDEGVAGGVEADGLGGAVALSGGEGDRLGEGSGVVVGVLGRAVGGGDGEGGVVFQGVAGGGGQDQDEGGGRVVFADGGGGLLEGDGGGVGVADRQQVGRSGRWR